MTIAVIVAGGVGNRMGQSIPKQFINVYDKPILLYTLEGFERHPMVDAIEVVCIEGWEDTVWSYAQHYNISKLKWIVTGGAMVQESIRNGVFSLEDKCSADDVIIIHDGIRPLVDAEVLTDVIRKAQQYGNDDTTTKAFIPRETIRRVCTPQAYQFSLLDEKYHEAFDRQIGIHGSHYTNTMMVELGVTLHFAAGSDKNIKLTTPDDLEIFKGYLAKDRI